MADPRRLLASGWIPALLVYAVAVATLAESTHVEVRDQLAFTLWLLWSATVPGVVAWRAVDWRGRTVPGGTGTRATGRPFLEDAVLGSILGMILSIPAYLVAVTLGAPLLVLAWPLLVLLPAALTRPGRALLLRRQAEPSPAWWSWSLAAAMLFVIAFSAETQWLVDPFTATTLRAPYVDEPYHLSLVAEFRHHFPAQVPFVDGTPLKYHWLFYPVVAAASWGSGVAPIVLLRFVVPAALSGLLVLGVAVAASRLSGRRWAAPAAIAVLCSAGSLDVLAWTGINEPWLATGWLTYKSPTQALANALCPLLVVLLAGMLRGAARRPHHWVVVFVVMLAVAGSKSAMLPLFVAGLAGTAVVMLVVRRRVPWTVAGLAALSLLTFGLATVLFYGSGSRAMTIGPLQIIDSQAAQLGFVELGEDAGGGVRTFLTAVFVLTTVAQLVAALGLFVRRGWRRPLPWVLLGCWVAGLGVYLVFHHPAFGQAYFFRSTVVPIALLATLGWARAAGPMTRRTAGVTGVAVLAGMGWAWLVPVLVPAGAPAEQDGSDVSRLFASFGVPMLVAAVGVLVAALVHHVLTGPSRRVGATLHVVISAVLGMTLLSPIAGVVHWSVPEGTQTQTIPDGGISAATWLREHSDPDDLVATNAHTPFPRGPEGNYRHFWISAYTERRVLVEGWAYIPPESVGLPSNDVTNSSNGAPFWHPERLRLNDEVFTNPTEENIAELHERYGVDWLFVERRRQPDIPGLLKVAERRYGNKDFVIFRIGERD